MAKVTIGDNTFDVPESGVTGAEIKRLADLPPDSTPYVIGARGEHRAIGDSERAQLADGDRLGSVSRFTAA